ncbi:MAG: cytochrome P450 [Nannocystaceae bacterium]
MNHPIAPRSAAPHLPPAAELSWRRLSTFLRAPLDLYVELARHYGDFVRIPVPGSILVQVSDPDAIEAVLVRERDGYAKGYFLEVIGDLLGDGLLLSDGETWRQARRLYQTGFTAAAVRRHAETMVRIGAERFGSWERGGVTDVHRDMERIALDVVTEALLGRGFAREVRACTRGVETILRHLSGIGSSGLRIPQQIPTPGNRRFRRALHETKQAAMALVAQARARPADRAQLLDALMRATDAEGRPLLSDEAVRDELLTVIMAGHQTTALLLTFAAHLIAANPPVQRKLREEVDRALDGQLPGVDHLEALPYTRATIKEVLRLYPPVMGVDRRALRPATLGPFEVPAGANVAIMTYVVQRDPRWYRDPEAFRPERWMADGGEAPPPRFAYLPFGAGHRTCIGNHFSILEGTLLVALLVQRFNLYATTAERLEVTPGVTLQPRRPIALRTEVRRR